MAVSIISSGVNKKMMLIEHLVLAFIIVTVCYLLVLAAALFAQFLDVDHKCKELGVFDNAKMLVKCGVSTGIEEFPQECYCLHRGVLHNVKLVYIEAILAVLLIGLTVGHAIHLAADGYEVVNLGWILETLRRLT